MNKKFKQWATACRLAADQGAGNVDDLRSLANFLNSLADMSKDEPDEDSQYHNDTHLVTRVNRNWWKALCWHKHSAWAKSDAKAIHAMQELAAKDARIKELEQYKEWVAPQLDHAIAIEHANNIASQYDIAFDPIASRLQSALELSRAECERLRKDANSLRITYSEEDGLFLAVRAPSGKQGGIVLNTKLPTLKAALIELAINLDDQAQLTKEQS